MKKVSIGSCTLYQGGMEDIIPSLTFDHIFTDPPYLYLKEQFDCPFDEKIFFENAQHILKDDGFIALFGRGTSFYRWNTSLAEQGFVFREEVVWDKHMISNICGNLLRCHETVSIHTKKNGKIRRVKVPYIEMKRAKPERMAEDVKRIKSAIGNKRELEEILEYLKVGSIEYKCKTKVRHGITAKTIGNTTIAVRIVKSIKEGCVERSIIEEFPVHYGSIHPTQKPVRLAERILALMSDVGETVYDPFMGSGSFGVACVNMGRKYIGSEINERYFSIAKERIEEAVKRRAEANNG